LGSLHQPGALTGRKTRRQVAVVDFTGDREAFELRRRNEQARIVGKPVTAGVDIAFRGRYDAITVRVYTLDFCGIRVEQTLREWRPGLEGGEPFIDVEEDLIRQSAWNEALPELALRIIVRVELVGIALAGTCPTPTVLGLSPLNCVVDDTCRSGTRSAMTARRFARLRTCRECRR
jgi:hypothetical protein